MLQEMRQTERLNFFSFKIIADNLRIGQPEEHTAAAQAKGKRHLIRRTGSGHRNPVGGKPYVQGIRLCLQMPTQMIWRPQKLQLVSARQKIQVRRNQRRQRNGTGLN